MSSTSPSECVDVVATHVSSSLLTLATGGARMSAIGNPKMG